MTTNPDAWRSEANCIGIPVALFFEYVGRRIVEAAA